MMISLWRYSHFTLAVSSFLFLAMAALSGMILAFEPVTARTGNRYIAVPDSITLAHIVPVVKNKFADVQQLAVDANKFVVVTWTNQTGELRKSTIHPVTGDTLGTPPSRSALFQWTTGFHRSLFMHDTGRLMVGITALLLILITVSGIALVIQRQQGVKRFFARVENTGFAQYYHVVFGRLLLLPILAIAVTGGYLSFSRFVLQPQKQALTVNTDNIATEPEIPPASFPVFQQIKLSQLETLDFPFSTFPEDYFTVKLKDRAVCVNQFTGGVLARQYYPRSYILANLSLEWHTGRSGMVWAILLAISAAYILFFIYSGFVITWKRTRSRHKNKYKPGECRIIILVGSENGSSFGFAASVYRQLVQHGQKAYITDLNNYRQFPKAMHLVIMTSTYGQGDAPFNARHFITRLLQYPQQQSVSVSVLGFGSRSYAQFCRFACVVDEQLRRQSWAIPATELVTVNDRSPQDFSHWLTAWSTHTGIPLQLSRELLMPDTRRLEKMTVMQQQLNDTGDTFLIRLQPARHASIRSGDLLAIYPKNDHRERLYSIGRQGKNIQLSVRLHAHGLGSSYLHQLQAGAVIQARVIKNQHFHFPAKTAQVIMIANGTGIAPFLGMISDNKKRVRCYLYGGFRDQASFALYSEALETGKREGRLTQLTTCFSREGGKRYVTNSIAEDRELMAATLRSGGVVMICGSLAMHQDVMALLEVICREQLPATAAAYAAAGKILSDCY